MSQTWSHSREALLQECERKFALTYTLGARRNSADERLRQVAVLKTLKSVPLRKGEVVHSGIADYWNHLANGGKSPARDQWVAASLLKAKRQWLFSTNRLYWRPSSTQSPDYAGLMEHEYDSPCPAVDEVLGEIEDLLDHGRDLIEKLRLDVAFLNSRRRWIEPPIFGLGATTFRVGTCEVFTKVDLALVDLSEQLHIYDWKTGRETEDNHEAQMELYALWGHLGLGFPLERISTHVVYFQSKSVLTHSLTPGSKIARLRKIKHSIQYLDSLLPAAGEAPLDHFDYAAQLATCQRCALRKVCGAI